MGLCDALMRGSQAIWAREKEHPFVRGMGDGSLDEARFRFYLEQDYLFLIEYAKVFALAVTRAGDVATMAYLAQLSADTLNGEMELHRSYCAEFGIAPEALEALQPAPTTVGYTGHLLQVALTGSVVDVCAAVLPCQWGYNEIARHLQAQGLPEEPRYRKWIEMYASPEFEAYGRWLRESLERWAPGLAPGDVARLHRIFQASSRWEFRFWDMAWHREGWETPGA